MTTMTRDEIDRTLKSIGEKTGLKLTDLRDMTGYKLGTMRGKDLGHRVSKAEFSRTLETIDNLLNEMQRGEKAKNE